MKRVRSLTNCMEVMEEAENRDSHCTSGTLQSLSAKTNAEHPGIIEIKYSNWYN